VPIRRMAVIAIVAVGLVAAGVAAFALSTQASGNATEMKSSDSTQKNVSDEAQQIISRLTASTQNAPALGNDDAKVTVVEFGDYQCTWCHRWHESTKDTLVQDYVETGKVRFLFKDFPINDLSDRASSMAAEAAYCAGDQDKYWEYHDELYVKWEGENTGWVTKDSLRQFADNVGLEQEAFSECLDSGKHSDLVRENYNLAVAIGLDATPSFIILSGDDEPKLLRGAHPYSTFEQVINAAYASS
jgi:protein-disulfide isomerase